MIAALYVQRRGCYQGLPDVDPWDEDRDARRYRGPYPVVAHPPCNRWCRMAAFATAMHGAPPPGEDGGTFAHALESVRAYGGILEHPAWSIAFARHGLSTPYKDGWQRELDGGWVCWVDQRWYGHRVRKPTWLYYHGARPPPSLQWGDGPESDTCIERLCSAERSRTPRPFRDLLIDIARNA